MVMGKGGVGKTTIAAAIAVGLARRGHGVHLSTTDPAAHVGFVVDAPLEHLKVDRIDPKEETGRYIEKVMAGRGKDLDDGSGGKIFFVSLLTGPQNESDYSYIGVLNPKTGEVRLTKASKFSEGTMVVRLLRRTLARVWAGEQEAIEAAGFRVHHEGRCCRCGRTLTVPSSVESGIGPECAEMMAAGR